MVGAMGLIKKGAQQEIKKNWFTISPGNENNFLQVQPINRNVLWQFPYFLIIYVFCLIKWKEQKNIILLLP